MKTVTYIASPADERCRFWAARLNKLSVDCLTSRAELDYVKKDSDLELKNGEMIITSEARHHRKSRGYEILLGMSSTEDNDIFWVEPTLDIKMHIKKTRPDLMVGSGDVTAALRLALFLQDEEEKVKIFKTFALEDENYFLRT